ncbi:GIY-YIG nuclease family protein [Psychrobacter sp. I-STPA10]|uniref:GIY-YIG nuclease family protein n=1 Tax=Psychrobacter sp. I-STPA10 TaxID=2585769 RepID=UPI001E47E36A|nr:GIY-YIG nuclease family protein [Psychrobacter sp. I-STPA10]
MKIKQASDLFATVENQAVVKHLNWIDAATDLPHAKGVYILAMQLSSEVTLDIGKLGAHTLPASIYFYVGSARGAGGLYSRVRRHWRNDESKAKRWHIDYLRTPMQMLGCWVAVDASDPIEECALAKLLASHPSLSTFVQVGSSDCRCASHVFYLSSA